MCCDCSKSIVKFVGREVGIPTSDFLFYYYCINVKISKKYPEKRKFMLSFTISIYYIILILEKVS